VAPIPIILDTDIGSDIDDAVALAYLLSHDDCELLGITTVSGQADLRAEMASAMCIHVGRDDIPVHSGADRPLLIDSLQGQAPQAEALGDRPRRRDFLPATAVEFLRRTIRARPDEVTLLAIGPLTNVAVLFACDPEIPTLLKQLVLMGGCFFGPRAEWNLRCDPHAAAIVYGQGSQACPQRHVSFGLDVTTQCTLQADAYRSRFVAKVLEPVRDFAEVFFARRPAITFHDPLAAACVFQPDICGYKSGGVQVSVTAPTAGVSVFHESADAPRHTVACEVDSKRFFGHYFDIVK